MDSITLNNLKVEAVIGTLPQERQHPQSLIFNLELNLNLQPAGESDDLQYSVDYQEIERRICRLAESTQYFLLEKLAEETAKICLSYLTVQEVAVSITKPAALLHSTPTIRIVRHRKA
ncbi:MAG: dihydroneopterin aldolase [Victivallaceae bacterium]